MVPWSVQGLGTSDKGTLHDIRFQLLPIPGRRVVSPEAGVVHVLCSGATVVALLIVGGISFFDLEQFMSKDAANP